MKPRVPVLVTCPICRNTYHLLDEPDEWERVAAHATLAAKLEQICHWLRAQAPGAALEVAEKMLSELAAEVNHDEKIKERNTPGRGNSL